MQIRCSGRRRLICGALEGSGDDGYAASRNPVKAPDLEVNEVADGYIVYQPDRDRVHYLNQTAAVLLELCNGRNAEADMPELLRLAWDLTEPPIEEVADCLESLRKEGLIT